MSVTITDVPLWTELWNLRGPGLHAAQLAACEAEAETLELLGLDP